MKKKILFLLFTLIAVSGCSKANGHTTLNALDKPLAWQEKREKPFGKYDYGMLDEQKFNKLLKEKFEVSLPKYYKDMTITFTKNFVTEEVYAEQPDYFITAQGETLYLKIVSQYKETQELVLYTTMEFEYVFDRENGQVTLKNQSVMINDASKEGKLLNNTFDQLITDMGQVTNIKHINKKLEEFHTLTKKEKDNLSNQIIVLYDDSAVGKERNELQKVLSVQYNPEGILKNTYFYIVDVIDEEK
ncbi:hypothetical protein BCR24_07510 [Enterococcus ureilyticus]|uniref:Lipoprotein n=1 Tax=Enterococcus ureilyticus TaxID=1131292 RepID=A0A1E5H8Z7_9ENTE|nr:hypothetical protein [Enterococcus ureilyticus]MBM7687469.1 hypothetical protein [Enterococcus ureilyticus]OEG21305.1 hypothetical protein BCR24_07510 [Enterococcus ureilyticus]